VWANGILGFPYINLPFTRFGKAMKARQELLKWLQVRLPPLKAVKGSGALQLA
jgi:hypothetical protein